MRMNPTLRNVLAIVIAAMIIYTIIDGIRYNSIWGCTMGSISLIALYFFVQLSRKLEKLRQEEEQEAL